jgi:hypothetical protein
MARAKVPSPEPSGGRSVRFLIVQSVFIVELIVASACVSLAWHAERPQLVSDPRMSGGSEPDRHGRFETIKETFTPAEIRWQRAWGARRAPAMGSEKSRSEKGVRMCPPSEGHRNERFKIIK